MKIVVTGGAGFIGSHLVDRLIRAGHAEIVILDNLYRGRRENVAQYEGNPAVRLVQGDIRDYATVERELRGAEIVYHLGAQSNVMGAVTDVDYSFQTNVVGTFHVLKAATAAGVRRVVFASSREAYGEARYLPVDEEHALDSKNTYGASKLAGEAYARVFLNNFGLQTAVLRLSNVYGPRDIGRVIPLWIERACQGQNLVVYGGQQVIDFVWIDTVVDALLRAAKADIVGRPVNVASGQGTPILTLAERIIRLAGSASRLDVQPARSAEVVRYTAKVERMRNLLGVEPPADPLAGLEALVGLYRKQGHI